MNVKSIETSTPYPPLFFQSPQILPTLNQVKDLIEAYKTKSIAEESIITYAKMLIEEVNQLEDIGVKRECFCRLLALEMEEVQNLIIEKMAPFLNISTIFYDIQHDQAQQLIELEEIVSEIMETKLKSNGFNYIIPICMLYQNILEHLWLLPHLEFNNRCSNLLNQNKNAILSKMERWKDSLYQLAKEAKISQFTVRNLEKAVLRIFKTLPEAVARDIERQKFIINKSERITQRLLEITAEVYGDQGDYPRAIFHTTILLKILTKEFPETSQNREELIKIMQMHGNLAIWNQILGQEQSAIFHVGEALKVAQELRNPYAIMICLKNIGSLYVRQEQGELALSFYTKAQSIAQTLKDRKSESQTLIGLADAYLSIDNSEEAIRCYQAALKLTENKFEQVMIYRGIGYAHANAQQYQSAKEAYYNALNMLPQEDIFNEIKIYRSLASLFANSGQYKKAIFYAEKILELTQHESIQKDESESLEIKFKALMALRKIYGTFGDYAREIDYQRQALKVAEKLDPFSELLGIAYTNLGSTYVHMENYSEAIDYYIKALEIVVETPKRAKILVNVARAFYYFGEFAEAIRYYKEANTVNNQEIKKYSLIGLGLCYDAVGNKEQATQNIKNFICLSQKSEDRHNEAIGYYYLGELYRKLDSKLAEEYYRKSTDLYVALHQELKSHSQWQITFFEEQAIPLLRLESLLLEQDKTEEALQVTDFRRSRALVSALAGKFKFQKESFLFSELTSQEMQAFAYKTNTCFILYSLSSENTDSITVWVIPSQGEIICQQLSLGNLTEEVKEATQVFKMFPFIVEPTIAKRRPFLRPKKTRSSATYAFLDELTRGEESESTSSAVVETFKGRLSLWYEALIAPLESHLPKDPQQVVTIIPDGFLAQVPFAAFLDKEGTYLIEKHPISIAPSIGILKLLDEIPKVFSENSLVIGNPTTLQSKDTLPLAEKEAQTIVASLLKTTPERTLLQDNATAQRVLEGMRDARWIHLACHGSTGTKPEEKIDSHFIFGGLFKLAPEQENPNGYLHAQEIAVLRLRTELVFMSACFSGRGKLHREGSVGPVWSFLAAGALSTVATYWRLPDSDLTLQMVDTFYRHLLGIEEEKLNKAQALQKAMLTAIEQKREQPDLWGAFFLSGLHA
ncbi:Uncharacterized protein PRO82_002282 [Candidatus Protochlamydia amoebophila]|uniref:CHAT domain-containing protein n=1 Tax=Candidatus Protochlamydia amoebophila TaxID=362787 RepID=UPI001BC99198|nr:CHAT domain-containing protein [Candidatus Protochlamydia amoebophila]MBS4164940.1 Uncharacterized protein [Candidatus Protochlamydia amoebophila]